MAARRAQGQALRLSPLQLCRGLAWQCRSTLPSRGTRGGCGQATWMLVSFDMLHHGWSTDCTLIAT